MNICKSHAFFKVGTTGKIRARLPNQRRISVESQNPRFHLGRAPRITGASALIALASNVTPWSVPSQALPSAR